MVDTSALVAVIGSEPQGEACLAKLLSDDVRLTSAVTLMEALVVADRRGLGAPMRRLVVQVALEVIPVSEMEARAAADAYARWGKGVHPARLNLADCFAYALARSRGAPLLYVGRDFAQTDVRSALADADL